MREYIEISFKGKVPQAELAPYLKSYFDASGLVYPIDSINVMAEIVCTGAGEIIGIVEDSTKALAALAVIRYGVLSIDVCVHPDFQDCASPLIERAMKIQNKTSH